MIIRKKTGPIQVGIAHVGDREWVAESFFQDDFADRAWYVNGEGKIKTGGGKDRSLTKNHPNIEVTIPPVSCIWAAPDPHPCLLGRWTTGGPGAIPSWRLQRVM